MTGTTHRRFLIDTVAAIAHLNEDTAILGLLDSDVRVIIPVIVLGELYAGAKKSARVTQNLQGIDQFADGVMVIPCDRETARIYSDVATGLRKKGRPIPPNDMWIAALAIQHHLTLLTRDAHFSQVDGLLLQSGDVA